ncbi:hypothetical protein MLD38_027826 [Melastoma candidum]|uniref:Uncharacterized protein n=1 Tax=Melastoma candidum TaxID=119954 RepID=A0ACB9P4K9_9MYRT|nr:hypothetical protein MLD38_027826 [Melastoma candidum]
MAMNGGRAKLRSLSLHLCSTSTLPSFPNSSAGRLLPSYSLLRRPPLGLPPSRSFLTSVPTNCAPLITLRSLFAPQSSSSHAFAVCHCEVPIH